jgi:streptogramin lyase
MATCGLRKAKSAETPVTMISIGRVTPTGQFTTIPNTQPSSSLQAIAMGPDGNLWFAAYDAIGRITPSDEVTQFPAPSGVHPYGIASGPDGNMWFIGSGAIGNITPTGQITEFPPLGDGRRPREIAAGPDGNMWFTETVGGNVGGVIGRITPAGQVTQFPIGIGGNGIAAGADGNVWLAAGNTIGRITPAGNVTEFALPGEAGSGLLSPGYHGAQEITQGPDGSLWFTDNLGCPGPCPGTPVIGRMTPNGQVMEFHPNASTNFSGPGPSARDITSGSDGNIWFTESASYPGFSGGAAIGRVTSGGPVIEISGARATAHRHWAMLALSCEGAGQSSPCAGNLRLSIAVKLPHVWEEVVLARRPRFELGPNETRPIAMRLSRKALRILARHRRLHVASIVTAFDHQIATTRTVALQRQQRAYIDAPRSRVYGLVSARRIPVHHDGSALIARRS